MKRYCRSPTRVIVRDEKWRCATGDDDRQLPRRWRCRLLPVGNATVETGERLHRFRNTESNRQREFVLVPAAAVFHRSWIEGVVKMSCGWMFG